MSMSKSPYRYRRRRNRCSFDRVTAQVFQAATPRLDAQGRDCQGQHEQQSDRRCQHADNAVIGEQPGHQGIALTVVIQFHAVVVAGSAGSFHRWATVRTAVEMRA
jgi:hypothetical protein